MGFDVLPIATDSPGWTQAWQIFVAVALTILTLNTLTTTLVGRSARIRRWWEDRWLPHIREVERDDRIEKVLAQFEPNGGETLRDHVDRIEQLIEVHLEYSQTQVARLDALEELIPDVRKFLDEHGERHANGDFDE